MGIVVYTVVCVVLDLLINISRDFVFVLLFALILHQMMYSQMDVDVLYPLCQCLDACL